MLRNEPALNEVLAGAWAALMHGYYSFVHAGMSKTISHWFRPSSDLKMTNRALQARELRGVCACTSRLLGMLPDKEGQKGTAANHVTTSLLVGDALLYQQPKAMRMPYPRQQPHTSGLSATTHLPAPPTPCSC